jgi:hypothetical protein
MIDMLEASKRRGLQTGDRLTHDLGFSGVKLVYIDALSLVILSLFQGANAAEY